MLNNAIPLEPKIIHHRKYSLRIQRELEVHRAEALACEDGLVRGRHLRVGEAGCEYGDCCVASLGGVWVVLNVFTGWMEPQTKNVVE